MNFTSVDIPTWPAPNELGLAPLRCGALLIEPAQAHFLARSYDNSAAVSEVLAEARERGFEVRPVRPREGSVASWKVTL